MTNGQISTYLDRITKHDNDGNLTGELNIEGFRIPVFVLDYRVVFNRIDLNVRPVMGSGEKWVSADRMVHK